MNTHDILDALIGTNDAFLFARDHEMGQWIFGGDVYLQAVVGFSNVCGKPLPVLRAARRKTGKLKRYRLHADAILECCGPLAVAQGAGTVVLQSGDDTGLFGHGTDRRSWSATIKARHDRGAWPSPWAAGGVDEYAFWREMRRGPLPDEAWRPPTRPALQASCARTRSFTEPAVHGGGPCAASATRSAPGVIAGLPGTSPMDALRDILFLTELEAGHDRGGAVRAQRRTPRWRAPDARLGSTVLSLRMTALLRILNPEADIPAASKPWTCCGPTARALALASGCNVLMPSITPGDLRRVYTIYPGKTADGLDRTESLDSCPADHRGHGLRPVRVQGVLPEEESCRVRRRAGSGWSSP